jgi:hypothetical protein
MTIPLLAIGFFSRLKPQVSSLIAIASWLIGHCLFSAQSALENFLNAVRNSSRDASL